MANKYEKYILTDLKPGLELPQFRGTPLKPSKKSKMLMWMGDILIKGSPYIECVWLWPRADNAGFPAHVHDYDEIIGFMGTDTANPYELNGEIEFWFDDEKYLLRKSCLLFIPANLKHCPIVFHHLDKPVFHFLMVTGGKYRNLME